MSSRLRTHPPPPKITHLVEKRREKSFHIHSRLILWQHYAKFTDSGDVTPGEEGYGGCLPRSMFSSQFQPPFSPLNNKWLGRALSFIDHL